MLREHSLRVILDNQDASGAYIACPNMADYGYSWFRDGAYIAYALAVDGEIGSEQYAGSMGAQWESVFRFHQWCAERIAERADGIARSIAVAERGETPEMGDLLNARYRADGGEGPDGWPEFQLDGIGTWLWSLRQYLLRIGFTPIPAGWDEAVDLAARYLAALWRMPCYDCWEERGDAVHVSTLAAIYAGLQAAEAINPRLNYAATCAELRQFVLTHGITPGGELAKSIGVDRVDANLIAAAVPHGLIAPDDPLMRRTVARIERELRAPDGGVYRHLEDEYYGGGEWVLLALHLAWYYADLGETARAQALLRWSEAQADADGNLPEQVTRRLLAPDHYDGWVTRRGAVASPLLWSHAEYLIVGHTLKLWDKEAQPVSAKE